MNWLAEHGGDILVLGLLALTVIAIIRGMYKNRKKGSPCGCDCSKCSRGCKRSEL